MGAFGAANGWDRILNYRTLNSGDKDMVGLDCLPGERVVQRAVLVRKKLSTSEGGGWLAGTLFCTYFRLAFVPQDAPRRKDDGDPVLLGDHDVALTSIEKVVAVGPSRAKHVTPSSSLRSAPEQLVLYCRDMRVLCFLFDRLTPPAQVMQMTYTLARAYQPLSPRTVCSFQNATLGNTEMKQLLSNRRRDPDMNWFEGVADWEAELERTGAVGWRVSSVNDRFEMAPSLPRYNVVPHRVLDTELKRTFAHFHEGRIPRWCWRHPAGSDLLRTAGFQNNIYHEKDDIRNLESLLFGGQQRCVVVELGEEMPTLGEVQLAHTRLRALCLGDISSSLSVPDEKWLSSLEATRWLDHVRCCLKKAAEVACLLRDGHLTVILQEPEDRDMNCVVCSLVQVMSDPHCRTRQGLQGLVQKEWVAAGHPFLSRGNCYRHRDRDREEAPVFLLFLDCVWQLWAQFPSYFQLTEEYLLVLQDSTHLPLYCTYLHDCQRERSRRSQHLPQSYTPINGWREGLAGDSYPMDPPFPPVWDWALWYSPERRERFTHPVAMPTLPLPVLNGDLIVSQSDGTPGRVFLLSRGGFSSPSFLLPWRGGGGGVMGGASSVPARRNHRLAPPPESSAGLERLLAGVATPPSGPQEPLLPLLFSPCVGIWRACYLRGALQAQAFCHPPPLPGHPVEILAREVEQLRERLASAGRVSGELETPDREVGLDQKDNNGALFLGPESQSSVFTLLDSLQNSDLAELESTVLFSAT
ncbi:myotubularin-related protein 11-like [Anguilla anguilla]|uniref:myotubularin-related protein 11-like n=1 Tax=Anguilla anguilla TaxID=7936 RepID=UPI0015A92F71|nr:myotubularin-related protein 11-like [Anguilla anguilla]